MKAYFSTFIGYAFIASFLIISGVLFTLAVMSQAADADVTVYYAGVIYSFVVLIPLLIKELAMLIGGMLVIKRQKVVAQAVWYGKLATVVIFVSAFVRLLVRDCLAVDIAVCAVILTMLVFSLLMYYFKIFRGKYNETIRKQ